MTPIDRAREAAREGVAKRICMAAHGGDAERNHTSIAFSWVTKRDDYLAQADAAMARYEAALSAEGLVLVPKVASEAMQNAGVDEAEASWGFVDEGQIKRIWSAMLAA